MTYGFFILWKFLKENEMFMLMNIMILHDLVQGFDQETAVVVIARLTSHKMEIEVLFICLSLSSCCEYWSMILLWDELIIQTCILYDWRLCLWLCIGGMWIKLGEILDDMNL